ncbi:uncharacterized protein LOC143327065 [Chaetodon auriga]|uniref:uncharacterized protein LOC143327065 n=1 Tax=Chaetodon auriga TaxID=39042 RepID=UPI004033070D
MCASAGAADMASLQHLNAFISQRLTTAAVEIFGAVQKTLIEYQGEISRSKQEIDHLRKLVLWPQSPLSCHSAAHQFSPRCCDKDASPECCPEEERTPHVSPDHPSTLSVKEEPEHRAARRGPSCRQQSDVTVSPQAVTGDGHEESSSHLYRLLTVEQTADIKAEPDADEFPSSPSTSEAEAPRGVNPESSGSWREDLTDPLEVTHVQDGPDEQPHTEQDWSPCQDHKDRDPPHIKEEKCTSPQEDTGQDNRIPPQSERRVYDEPQSSSLNHNQTLTSQTFYTPEERRRHAKGGRCRLTRVSQHFCSADQSKYGEITEGVVNGECMKALRPTGMRPKNNNSCTEGRDSVGMEEDVNDLTRKRRHICPICAKRFKESSHLKDHVRIHTGEKPYRCKECGMNFRQSGALTLHARIHTGERPYQCTDCGRRFNRKGDMEAHRVTHTGERPHLCVVCGKSFKRKNNLNTHLKIHAEDNMDYTQPL